MPSKLLIKILRGLMNSLDSHDAGTQTRLFDRLVVNNRKTVTADTQGTINLLGLHHRHLFLDGSRLLGYRLGSAIFECYSDAIRYIIKIHGHNALMNYIDDLIYIGLPSKIHDSYQFCYLFCRV